MDKMDTAVLQGSLSQTVGLFRQDTIQALYLDRVPTGFPRLDALLGGGLPTGLTVLGAISSLGKSTLALQIAQHISAGGRDVLYFSLEMSETSIAAKAITRQMFLNSGMDVGGSLTASQLMSRDYMGREPDRWPAVDAARAVVEEQTRHLHIRGLDGDGTSAHEIVYQAVAFANETEGPLPVVMVDYLQILRASDVKLSGTSRLTVDDSIRHLVHLSKETPVVLISSVNRQSYGEALELSSFKESGAIEFSADVLLGLQYSGVRGASKGDFDMDAAREAVPRKVEVVILKQRYGPCGPNTCSRFDYYAAYDLFSEQETGPRPEETEEPTEPKTPGTRIAPEPPAGKLSGKDSPAAGPAAEPADSIRAEDLFAGMPEVHI